MRDDASVGAVALVTELDDDFDIPWAIGALDELDVPARGGYWDELDSVVLGVDDDEIGDTPA